MALLYMSPRENSNVEVFEGGKPSNMFFEQGLGLSREFITSAAGVLNVT